MTRDFDSLVTSELTLRDIEFIDPAFAAEYGQATANRRRLRYYRQREWRQDRLELALLVFCGIALGALVDRILVVFS